MTGELLWLLYMFVNLSDESDFTLLCLVKLHFVLALVDALELFFSLVSVNMCVFTFGVAWSSVCPVPAREVFNDVRFVPFSRNNKSFLPYIKALSLMEPTKGNRNSSNIKIRRTKRDVE